MFIIHLLFVWLGHTASAFLLPCIVFKNIFRNFIGEPLPMVNLFTQRSSKLSCEFKWPSASLEHLLRHIVFIHIYVRANKSLSTLSTPQYFSWFGGGVYIIIILCLTLEMDHSYLQMESHSIGKINWLKRMAKMKSWGSQPGSAVISMPPLQGRKPLARETHSSA